MQHCFCRSSAWSGGSCLQSELVHLALQGVARLQVPVTSVTPFVGARLHAFLWCGAVLIGHGMRSRSGLGRPSVCNFCSFFQSRLKPLRVCFGGLRLTTLFGDPLLCLFLNGHFICTVDPRFDMRCFPNPALHVLNPCWFHLAGQFACLYASAPQLVNRLNVADQPCTILASPAPAWLSSLATRERWARFLFSTPCHVLGTLLCTQAHKISRCICRAPTSSHACLGS